VPGNGTKLLPNSLVILDHRRASKNSAAARMKSCKPCPSPTASPLSLQARFCRGRNAKSENESLVRRQGLSRYLRPWLFEALVR
jgi:hypothetical protein